MTRFAPALVLALVLAGAPLAGAVTVQWKGGDRTLAALIAEGYEVRAAATLAVGPVLYLQKGKSLYRCWEREPLLCEELTPRHDVAG